MFGLRSIFSSSREVREVVLRAIREHGVAAEAYLNYPLQDQGVSSARARLARAALRELRRLKRQYGDEDLDRLAASSERRHLEDRPA